MVADQHIRTWCVSQLSVMVFEGAPACWRVEVLSVNKCTTLCCAVPPECATLPYCTSSRLETPSTCIAATIPTNNLSPSLPRTATQSTASRHQACLTRYMPVPWEGTEDVNLERVGAQCHRVG